jgi:hypothetical protein
MPHLEEPGCGEGKSIEAAIDFAQTELEGFLRT